MLNRLKTMLKPDEVSRTSFSAPLSVPDPVYVIGDIHGCMDLLDRLSQKIQQDATARGIAEQARVVYIGDYVDRGEQSAAVLKHLFDLTDAQPNRHICLKGNHESMMLDFLRNPVDRGPRWIRYGGLQTLASYGIGGVSERSDADDLKQARDDLLVAMPAGMKEWLKNLPSLWQSGNLTAVHAALDPFMPIQGQEDRIRLWGHNQFFSHTRSDGEWVVHGHTIVDQAGSKDGRVSIDTGAYATGRLTAAGFDGDQMWFLGT